MHLNWFPFAGPLQDVRPFEAGRHTAQRVFFPHFNDLSSMLAGTSFSVANRVFSHPFTPLPGNDAADAIQRQVTGYHPVPGFGGDGASQQVQAQVFRRVVRGLTSMTLTDGSSGGGTSVDAYEDGVSVIAAITRLDFKDSNAENPSGTIAAHYLDVPGICFGRLTLTTAVPITVSDVTAATTVYWTPYLGSQVSLYDGTRWKKYTFTEKSIGVTQGITCGTTNGTPTLTCSSGAARQLVAGMKVSGVNIGAAAVVVSTTATTITVSVNSTGTGTNSISFKCPASTNYDIFVIPYSGTPELRFSRQWASGTGRNDALGLQDGVDVNNGVIASGESQEIPAKQGRYLGTIRTTTTDGQTEDSKGGTTTRVGGKRFLFNHYHRQPREMFVKDTADSWSYTSATVRLADAALATAVPDNCCEYVTGDAATKILVENKQTVSLNANATRRCHAGVGIDSITAFAVGTYQGGFNGLAGFVIAPVAGGYAGAPGLGYHYVSMLEAGADITCAFTGDDAGDEQNGMTVWLVG